jgi:hypothetical protein
MAGCNLPGNGVTAILQNEADDRLSMYTNENRRETTLAADGQPGYSKIFIMDTAGFKTYGYACIAAPTVDTLYKRITRIGVNNSGPDTLYFSSNLYYGPFPVATTHVYPAVRVRYQVYGNPAQKLYRVRNTDTLRIGGLLDSLNIIPKNAAGNPVGFASDQASVITVLLGGHVGKDRNRVFIGDSIEVNIRNVN